MTPSQKKLRYRMDPEFRAAILASNQESRRRDANPNRKRLNRVASEICRLRQSIEYHQQALERADRRLVARVAERERLKLGMTTKDLRLERAAAEMREHNLTHGTGCRAIARAIEQRTGGAR